jgi:hypothetical protein
MMVIRQRSSRMCPTAASAFEERGYVAGHGTNSEPEMARTGWAMSWSWGQAVRGWWAWRWDWWPAGPIPRARPGARGHTARARPGTCGPARRSRCEVCGFRVPSVHEAPQVARLASSSAATLMPSERKADATRGRSSRPTSNCMPGGVRATMRTEKVSTSILSTPVTVGGSRVTCRRRSSVQASWPTCRSMPVTRLTSTADGTGPSMTALAQSRDRLVTWTIWPLGVVMTSPLAPPPV